LRFVINSESSFAFVDFLKRSYSLEGSEHLDRIFLRDYVREIEIGAYQHERGVTQRVRFSVVVEIRSCRTRIDDDVDQVLSYDKILSAIGCELTGERVNLLETLAERICDRLLKETRVIRVFIRIDKLDRVDGALGIELVRSRHQRVDGEHREVSLRPRLIFFSNSALSSPFLSGWLDQLEQDVIPAVLCVGVPDGSRPTTNHVTTQRRIDLLAIEQNAWMLAARDSRCVVVSTWSELEWAAENQKMSVWAPSKIVLDSVKDSSPGPNDPLGLAAWLAKKFDAYEMIIFGVDPAFDAAVPLRSISIDQAVL